MLFEEKHVPLADKIRPNDLQKLVGQSGLSLISLPLNQSLIFWGPPGCGKTSAAKILAKNSGLPYEETSGVMHGTQKFKNIFETLTKTSSFSMILIVDEIHHLNKSQQDIFLPYLESGSLILIGTTTENPSFELRPALLSRAKVVTFNGLDLGDLNKILENTEDFMKKKLPLTKEARMHLCLMSDGDGRYLVNRAEELFLAHLTHDLNVKELEEFVPKRSMIYDKSTEEHYNLLSALHKSLRGSDVDAALYWAQRMLIGGENPLVLTRRLIRFATEDIGLADPNALLQAIAAHNAYLILGSPEGELAITNLIIYLATAPKSNASYIAYKESKKCAEYYGSLPTPLKIRNAPTKLMKDLGYSNGYLYDHDTKNGFSGENFFPDELSRKKFYSPVERGFEREIKKRIEWFDSLRIKNLKN